MFDHFKESFVGLWRCCTGRHKDSGWVVKAIDSTTEFANSLPASGTNYNADDEASSLYQENTPNYGARWTWGENKHSVR